MMLYRKTHFQISQVIWTSEKLKLWWILGKRTAN